MPAIESRDDALLHHARQLAMLACESYVSVGSSRCQTCAQAYEAHILKGVLEMLDSEREDSFRAGFAGGVELGREWNVSLMLERELERSEDDAWQAFKDAVSHE